MADDRESTAPGRLARDHRHRYQARSTPLQYRADQVEIRVAQNADHASTSLASLEGNLDIDIANLLDEALALIRQPADATTFTVLARTFKRIGDAHSIKDGQLDREVIRILQGQLRKAHAELAGDDGTVPGTSTGEREA